MKRRKLRQAINIALGKHEQAVQDVANYLESMGLLGKSLITPRKRTATSTDGTGSGAGDDKFGSDGLGMGHVSPSRPLDSERNPSRTPTLSVGARASTHGWTIAVWFF